MGWTFTLGRRRISGGVKLCDLQQVLLLTIAVVAWMNDHLFRVDSGGKVVVLWFMVVVVTLCQILRQR